MLDPRASALWFPDPCTLPAMAALLGLAGLAPAVDALTPPGSGHAQRGIAHRFASMFGPRVRMTTTAADGYYVGDLSLPLA